MNEVELRLKNSAHRMHLRSCFKLNASFVVYVENNTFWSTLLISPNLLCPLKSGSNQMIHELV